MLKTDKTRRQEHETVRNHVGYYDFTHELVEVTGPDSGKFLDRIFVNSMEKAPLGDSVYTTMLNEEGEIIDDLIVFRLDDELYWVSTLYSEQMLEQLEKYKEEFDVSFRDITDEVHMYAIQGPDSRKLLNKILETGVEDLENFKIRPDKIDDFNVYVARAGFTGELGYEIYLHPDKKETLVNKLEEEGKEFNVAEITTDVTLKSLPVEKGYVLMSDVGELTPKEALFGWSVDWDTDFVGKEALKEKENSPQRLYGYKVLTDDDNVEIEEGSPVFVNGEEVGKVTSFTYGYTVGDYIGFVLLDTSKVKKGDEFTVKSGGKEYRAVSHDRVFYDPEDSHRTA